MAWTLEHDLLLCREILVLQPFQYKFGSREKGQCWDKIAKNLHSIENPKFSVDQRGVRERYAKIERHYRRKMADEERASGISPDKTELDEAVESIIGLTESALEELNRNDSKKLEEKVKEQQTAQEVRNRSMERLAESREREHFQDSGRKKRKQSGQGVIEYLTEKAEGETEVKGIEIDLKRRELDLKQKTLEYEMKESALRKEERYREERERVRRDEEIAQAHLEILKLMKEQQKMLQTIILQNQEQNSALLSFLEKAFDKK